MHLYFVQKSLICIPGICYALKSRLIATSGCSASDLLGLLGGDMDVHTCGRFFRLSEEVTKGHICSREGGNDNQLGVGIFCIVAGLHLPNL